jgi:hypothetical protein
MRPLILVGAALMALQSACCAHATPKPSSTDVAAAPSAAPGLLGTFVGRWATVSEFQTEPGGALQQSRGSAVGRALGERWVVLEHQGTHFGTPFTGLLIVGHDREKEAYPAVWLDSLSSNLARYEGAARGSALTLRTEIPNPKQPGATLEVREEIEVQSPDQFTLTTKVRQGDGWATLVTVRYQRQP